MAKTITGQEINDILKDFLARKGTTGNITVTIITNPTKPASYTEYENIGIDGSDEIQLGIKIATRAITLCFYPRDEGTPIQLNEDISHLMDTAFYTKGNVTFTFEGFENFDTSLVSNVSYFLKNTTSLATTTDNISLVGLNTQNIQSLNNFIYSNNGVNLIGLDDLTFENVTDMSSAFTGDGATFNGFLKSFSSFKTSKVTTFKSCFEGNQDGVRGLGFWDLSSAENLSKMFKNCRYVRSYINIPENNKISNYTEMFGGECCSDNASLILINFHIKDKALVDNMIKTATYPERIRYGNITFSDSTVLEPLEENATVEDVTSQIEKLNQYNEELKTKFSTILGLKGETVTPKDKISDMILKVNDLSPSKQHLVYGVSIDLTNPDPYDCVSYIDDAVGSMTGSNRGYGSWADRYPFNKTRICGFENGQVIKYINPDNWSLYEDGTTVNTTTTDVMVEIPKVYWKANPTEKGFEIRISQYKLDDDYLCLAHTVGKTEMENIYIASYQGVKVNGKLRSQRGKIPLVSSSIETIRNYAQANGEGYQQLGWYPLTLVRILFMICFKELDVQTALGLGYVRSANTAVVKTGTVYNLGMIYGETSGGRQINFLGMEGLWGNINQFVDGIYLDASRYVLISDQTVFNNNGQGYVKYGQAQTANKSGWLSDVMKDSHCLFVPSNTTGSSTTYFADQAILTAGRLMAYGGVYNGQNNAGLFSTQFNYAYNTANATTGGRLMYIGVDKSEAN